LTESCIPAIDVARVVTSFIGFLAGCNDIHEFPELPEIGEISSEVERYKWFCFDFALNLALYTHFITLYPISPIFIYYS